MEAKKQQIECHNCHEMMIIDFETATFATAVQVINGKKSETRTYLEKCPNCDAVNKVTSDNKEEWGKRKGPNVKFFMYSGMFGCIAFLGLGILAIYFAFKGLGFVMDWLIK
ncbi:redox protein [Solibacillus daqui]|uniref:redox protein n=1 Tax=Solibacillus daqui TaxID=2912187 RepID=UPI0023662FB8|nr:redox protein [Solibacillus daqui]